MPASLPSPAQAPVQVTYIGGLGRSGSTLVERLLSATTGSVTVGELVHLWHRGLVEDELCACGRRFSACPFWQAVGDAAFGGWSTVDVPAMIELQAQSDRTRHVARLAASRAPLAAGEPSGQYGEVLHRLYAGVLQVSGASGVIDASKHASTAFLLSRTPGVALRVVHVVRDSPAVAYSWTRLVRRPQVPDRLQHMATYSPSRSVVQWSAQNALIDLLATRGAQVLRVRYEDVVAQPGAQLRRLLEFLDVEPAIGDAVLAGGLPPDLLDHAISGNPGRLAAGPVRLRRDDVWRVKLPPATRRLVAAATFPLRLRYGYLGRHRPVEAVGVLPPVEEIEEIEE